MGFFKDSLQRRNLKKSKDSEKEGESVTKSSEGLAKDVAKSEKAPPSSSSSTTSSTPSPGDSPDRVVIKVKNKEKFDKQTSKNTHMNSLMYHTSDDTVDHYAQENNSSDLLGRIYYDDFDSDSATSPRMSKNTTPLISPSGSFIGSDYFNNRGGGTSNGPGTNGVSTSNPSSTPQSLSTSPSFSEDKLKERPKLFSRGISFDTSSTTNPRKSLTLKEKHPKFKFRRNNKTFLTGYNNDQESLKAIEWLFDEMVMHGDTIVVLQVLDERYQPELNRDSANITLKLFESLNKHNKKISIVYELVIGNPQRLLKDAIEEYSPAMMAIGTHQIQDREINKSKEQHHKFLTKTASLSRYFLEYGMVPVIVVKTTYNHSEVLSKEIDSPKYFADWLKNIDISHTFVKDKKKTSMFKSASTTTSPTLSRNPSSTNLDERGRSNVLDDPRFKAALNSAQLSAQLSRELSREGKRFRLFH